MRKKVFLIWSLGIILLILVLAVIIRVYEPAGNGISRAAAYKALALSMTSKEECEELYGNSGGSQKTDEYDDEWYGKYADYLYKNSIISQEKYGRTDYTGNITYGEVYDIAQKKSKELADSIKVSKRKQDNYIPETLWWDFYDLWIKDSGSIPEETEVMVYQVSSDTSDTVYTDKGTMGCEGINIVPYLDNKITIVSKSGEILRIKNIISDSVVYSNVWISENTDETFTAYLGNIMREFKMKSSLGDPTDFVNQVADIHVTRGKLSKVVVKKDRIRGKVLSVKDDSIEIEGYGVIPTDEFFRVFKTYGKYEAESRRNILVGYDIYEFVADDGKLCAALITRMVNAEVIRVLIMDTGFNSIYHNSASFICDSDINLSYGNNKETVNAGDEIVIKPEDSRFKAGRITLEAVDKSSEISFSSVERSQGVPSYGGKIEISSEDSGLTVINELYMEDYLKKVVPSEMPASYDKEALKAQAVCARTYAYMQIISNAKRVLGAHVDDSTNYQVYNNISTSPSTDTAVMETYGQLIMYDKSPVNAYYYSTSCGTSTDGTVWGGVAADTPYLESHSINKDNEILNLTTNDAFSKFIKDKDFTAYDSEYPFFRWETSVTNRVLNDQMTETGNILSLKIIERGPGGIARKLRIDGSGGSKIISGPDAIRAAIGVPSMVIKKNDGSTVTGWSSLPSSYFAIEAEEPDENNIITFHIYGGGYGHGAGMSQNAAQSMAKLGMNYKEILGFFYSEVEIESPESN